MTKDPRCREKKREGQVRGTGLILHDEKGEKPGFKRPFTRGWRGRNAKEGRKIGISKLNTKTEQILCRRGIKEEEGRKFSKKKQVTPSRRSVTLKEPETRG